MPPARRLAGAFLAVTVSLKLLRHYALQTQAFDLGIFANVAWNTLHGRPFMDSIKGINYLGDHFSPALALLAPLFLVWESAAVLLVVQCLALAACLPAVHRLARRAGLSEGQALFLAAYFAVFPYVHQINSHDFEAVILAVPVLLWALCFWDEGRLRPFLACLGAAWLVQEDLALVSAGVGLYVAAAPRRRLLGAGIAAAGLGVFCAEAFWLMPAFLGEARLTHLPFYGNLGATPIEILRSLADPGLLWRQTLGQPEKLWTLANLVLWTGGLVLFSGRRLILLAVPLSIHLLSGREVQFRLLYHYSATALPFLFYCMAHGWRPAASLLPEIPRARRALAMTSGAAAALAAGVLGWPGYVRGTSLERVRAARSIMARVPPGASITAQTYLVPHLCLRREIRVFPDRRPSEYALFDIDHPGWTLPAGYADEVVKFWRAGTHEAVAAEGGFVLLRRRD